MTLLLRFVAAVVACTTTLVAAQPYRQLKIVSGTDQVVGLGEPLAPIVLRALDENGQPYQGMRVAFPPACKFYDYLENIACMYAPQGDSLERVSDANGYVLAPAYVANQVKGNARMYIYSRGEPNLLQAAFYLRIVEWGSHDPYAIKVVSGTNQEVPLGATTALPIVVRVVDQAGAPVAGVTVGFIGTCQWLSFGWPEPCMSTFTGGMVNVTTDANGLATSPRFAASGIVGFSWVWAHFSQDGVGEAYVRFNNVVPRKQASASSATGAGEMALRIAGSGSCHLLAFEPLAASQVPPTPAKVAFPQGFARIKLVGCGGSTPVSLSLQHPGDLPEGARIWASTPDWHPLETRHLVSGTTEFSLTDGSTGDAAGSVGGYIEAIVGLGFGDPDAPNFQDLWWAGSAENGWGVSIVQHGEMLVPTLFVYDAAGKPTWYAMPGGRWNESDDVFTGSLYSPRGKPLGAHTASDLVVGTAVGTASLTFSDAMNADLALDIGGVVTHKTLTRQLFGPMAEPTTPRRGDMWWAGPSQNGWGLVLQQQYSTLFGLLFTYREDGSPTWFAMPSGNWTAAGTFEGRAYRSSSSAWPKAYDAARLTSQEAGAFKLEFGGVTAGFEYVLDGQRGKVTLERLPF